MLVRQEPFKIRHRWIEIHPSDDNGLNRDESLEFRHPEIIDRRYKHVVDDILSQMGFSSLNFHFINESLRYSRL